MTVMVPGTTPGDAETARLRADIAVVREDLADTVAALVRKADVRSRIEQRASEKVRGALAKAEPLSRQAEALVVTAQALAPQFSALMSVAGRKQATNPVGLVLSGLFVLRLLRGRKRR